MERILENLDMVPAIRDEKHVVPQKPSAQTVDGHEKKFLMVHDQAKKKIKDILALSHSLIPHLIEMGFAKDRATRNRANYDWHAGMQAQHRDDMFAKAQQSRAYKLRMAQWPPS